MNIVLSLTLLQALFGLVGYLPKLGFIFTSQPFPTRGIKVPFTLLKMTSFTTVLNICKKCCTLCKSADKDCNPFNPIEAYPFD